jgi:transposase-like protein
MSETEKLGQTEEQPEKSADPNQEQEQIEATKPERRSIAKSAGILFRLLHMDFRPKKPRSPLH